MLIKPPRVVLAAKVQSDASSSGRSSGDPQTQGQQQQQPQAHDDSAHQAEQKRLWMAAIKPPMYSVGFIPVLVRLRHRMRPIWPITTHATMDRAL